MPLLFDDDYKILKDAGLTFTEDEASRFFIFHEFPLPEGIYVADAQPRTSVHVLYVIPENYNTSGGDMFWVNPYLQRADGKEIARASEPTRHSKTHQNIVYSRWSRHWNKNPWRPKVDNIRTIIDRITWALKYPDAKRP